MVHHRLYSAIASSTASHKTWCLNLRMYTTVISGASHVVSVLFQCLYRLRCLSCGLDIIPVFISSAVPLMWSRYYSSVYIVCGASHVVLILFQCLYRQRCLSCGLDAYSSVYIVSGAISIKVLGISPVFISSVTCCYESTTDAEWYILSTGAISIKVHGHNMLIVKHVVLASE